MCCAVLKQRKWMLRVQRQFHFGERMGLRFRADFFNIFLARKTVRTCIYLLRMEEPGRFHDVGSD
jgi:hypothetical protein